MLVIGTLLVIHQFRQPLPPELTRAIFDSAWERWQANAPANYSIEVQVVGPQPAIYAVTVQEGLVVSATRNGNPLPANPRTMRTWSVPGMFDTMEFDVMRLEKPEPSYLRLRARFDEHLGFPAQYHRDDNQNQFQMRWTVTEFEER